MTLTVDLGQPGEDWEAVTGKAEQLGAVETVVVDGPRGICRALRAAGDQGERALWGGYPLFTALPGR